MKASAIKALVFLALGLGLSQITLGSLTPEKNQNLWNALPAFGIFLLFVYALLSVGAFVRTLMKLPLFSGAENALFDLSVGVTVLYELAYLLTPFHLFSSSLRVFLWMLLSGAVVLGADHIHFKLWFQFVKGKWESVLLAIPLLLVVIRLIEGLQFHANGDAYIVYLPAPRSWAEYGDFHEYLKFTQYFLATTWESLYAWGTALMGLQGGRGLDLTQFFAQWCTGGIAVFGIVLGAIALSQRLALKLPMPSIWFPVIAISAAQVPVLRWTSNLGKNDTGIMFLGLAAFYCATFFSLVSAPLMFLVGVLTGAAVIGKLTISLLGICIGLSVLIRSPKAALYFAAGGIIGILPVVIRNYFLTGNPVFPWFDPVFHSGLLGPSFTTGSSELIRARFSLDALFVYLKELHFELPLWLGLVVGFAIHPKRKEILNRTWVPLLALFLFTLTFRSTTEVRYQNATLVIMSALISYFCFFLIQVLPLKFRTASCVLLSLFIIGTSGIPTFTLFQIGSSKFTAFKNRLAKLTSGEGKLWIRENLATSKRILLIGDPDVYYLMDYSITELSQSVVWDNKLENQDIARFEESLRSTQDFDYIALSNQVWFFHHIKKIRELMVATQTWPKECAKLETEHAQVWDVQCLQREDHIARN